MSDKRYAELLAHFATVHPVKVEAPKHTAQCAWCGAEIEATAETSADSHGICATCAEGW